MEIVDKILSDSFDSSKFHWDVFYMTPKDELYDALKMIPNDILNKMILDGKNFGIRYFCGIKPEMFIIQFCDFDTYVNMVVRGLDFCNLGESGRTMFHYLLENNILSKRLIERFYSKAPELANKPDGDFITPIGKTILLDDYESFKFFFSKGYHFNIDTKFIFVNSSLYLLCANKKTKNRLKMFELIMTEKSRFVDYKYLNKIERTIDEYLIDDDLTLGDTPLTMACKNSHKEYVRFLMELGANPQQKNASGKYPIFIAVAIGCEKIARILIDNGASYEISQDGITLDEACEKNGLIMLLRYINKKRKEDKKILQQHLNRNDLSLLEIQRIMNENNND